jgi:Tol biopolymer transport system component
MRRFLLSSLFIVAGVLFAASLPTPSNLKPEGLPPIQQDAYDAVTRYNEFRPAVLLDWAPARREILIATRFGDVPQIHRVALPGGSREQLTFFPDRVTQALFNPANGDEMLFRKDEGGGEFYQLYLDDLRTGKITLLTQGGRSRNSTPTWSRDGKSIAYVSTARDGQNGDVWIQDPHSDAHNPASARILLQTNEPGWAISDWSADGKQMLLTLEHSAVVSEVYLLDVASGQKQRLGPHSAEAGWFNPRFAEHGIYVISNEGHDIAGVYAVNSDMEAGIPTDSRGEPDQLAVSHDHRYLAYLTNEEGYSKLHLWDAP